VTVFLDLQIFDDIKLKYLPLPKRYDIKSNVPLSIDNLSLRKQLKHLWALPYFCFGCHLKAAPKTSLLNLIHHTMLAKLATKENKSTFTSSFNKKTAPDGKVTLKGFEILRRN